MRKINRNGLPGFYTNESKRTTLAIEANNKELLPALESIYSSLDIINKRLLNLENK
jgi:hypothetical protein